jgi:hypothetical protein
MKISKFLDIDAVREPITQPKVVPVVEDAPAPDPVESVIFPASDRFKHMLSLIARDNKELYNRIVGLE